VLAVSLGSVASPVSGSSNRTATTTHECLSDDATQLAWIVDRAVAGDAEAFGRLYDRFHHSVYRVVYAQTRSTTLTEDLTADTFFRALRAIQNYKLGADLFQAWLFRIARNLVIDHFKASRTRFEQASDMSRHEDVTDGTEAELTALLNRDRVRAALAEIPAAQRRVIELRFLCELSTAEVAALLDNTEGAVKQLQFRGLRNLARIIRD